jgi:hypothetical protein
MARHSSCPQWANPAAYDWKSRVTKLADRWAAQRAQSEQHSAQRSSLIKLARSALDLHLVSSAKGVCPRDDDGASQPLAAALAALKTAARNNRE